MSPFTLFRSAVCAGFAIGLGGAVYYSRPVRPWAPCSLRLVYLRSVNAGSIFLQARSAMPGNGLGAAIGSTQSS